MKKYYNIVAILSILALPTGFVYAQEAPVASSVTSVESVKSFARPSDARFQYSLPDKHKFRKKSSDLNDSKVEEVELDTSKAKPQKKIIKTMSADADMQNMEPNVNNTDMPMNYDNFPKYYDNNNMMQNQFMPMLPMSEY